MTALQQPIQAVRQRCALATALVTLTGALGALAYTRWSPTVPTTAIRAEHSGVADQGTGPVVAVLPGPARAAVGAGRDAIGLADPPASNGTPKSAPTLQLLRWDGGPWRLLIVGLGTAAVAHVLVGGLARAAGQPAWVNDSRIGTFTRAIKGLVLVGVAVSFFGVRSEPQHLRASSVLATALIGFICVLIVHFLALTTALIPERRTREPRSEAEFPGANEVRPARR